MDTAAEAESGGPAAASGFVNGRKRVRRVRRLRRGHPERARYFRRRNPNDAKFSRNKSNKRDTESVPANDVMFPAERQPRDLPSAGAKVRRDCANQVGPCNGSPGVQVAEKRIHGISTV